jgi:hypothetical protein
MDVKRKVALGVATLGIALGAGHLVQDGRTFSSAEDPAASEQSEAPSDIVVLSATSPATVSPTLPGLH